MKKRSRVEQGRGDLSSTFCGFGKLAFWLLFLAWFGLLPSEAIVLRSPKPDEAGGWEERFSSPEGRPPCPHKLPIQRDLPFQSAIGNTGLRNYDVRVDPTSNGTRGTRRWDHVLRRCGILLCSGHMHRNLGGTVVHLWPDVHVCQAEGKKG